MSSSCWIVFVFGIFVGKPLFSDVSPAFIFILCNEQHLGCHVGFFSSKFFVCPAPVTFSSSFMSVSQGVASNFSSFAKQLDSYYVRLIGGKCSCSFSLGLHHYYGYHTVVILPKFVFRQHHCALVYFHISHFRQFLLIQSIYYEKAIHSTCAVAGTLYCQSLAYPPLPCSDLGLLSLRLWLHLCQMGCLSLVLDIHQFQESDCPTSEQAFVELVDLLVKNLKGQEAEPHTYLDGMASGLSHQEESSGAYRHHYTGRSFH